MTADANNVKAKTSNVTDEEKINVVVSGLKENVDKFHEDIDKNKPKAAINPALSKPKEGGCGVPNMHDGATILTLEQIGKAIPILEEIRDSVKELPKRMAEELKNILP